MCLRIYVLVLITLQQRAALAKKASRSETIASRHLQYVWLADHCCMSYVASEIFLVTNNNKETCELLHKFSHGGLLRLLSWEVPQVVSKPTVLDPHATFKNHLFKNPQDPEDCEPGDLIFYEAGFTASKFCL